MNSSNVHDALDAMHQRNRERRIAGIKRWVEYIKSEPPETWGPQQNAVVNGQLDATQAADVSASHKRKVKDIAAEIVDSTNQSDDDAV